MRALIICLITFLSTAIPIVGAADSYLLNPKQILDVETGKLIQSKILVTDGKIVAISNSFKTSEDLKVIDLPDITLLPGLMDAHVHLIGNTDLKGYEGLSESSYLSTIYGVKNAKDTLMAGFTTVRNVGAGNYSDVALKQAISKQAVLGPTLLVSGPPLGITGGHCDSNTLPYDFKNTSDAVSYTHLTLPPKA